MRTAPPLSIGPLDPVDQEGVRALADAAAAVDGVAPLSEQPLLRLGADEPWLTHVTIHSKSGQVVGSRSAPSCPSSKIRLPDARASERSRRASTMWGRSFSRKEST